MFIKQLSVFVEAGAGGNLRFITEMETLLKGNNVSMDETRITTTRSFDRAFGFAYQAGAGLEIAKNLVIGCSFYDLGKADVKLEEITKKTTVNDNATTQSDPKYPVNGSLHPMMVLARIGFMF